LITSVMHKQTLGCQNSMPFSPNTVSPPTTKSKCGWDKPEKNAIATRLGLSTLTPMVSMDGALDILVAADILVEEPCS